MKKLEDVGVLVARILMPILFITAGWGKITGYAGTQQYMEAMGVPGALLPLTILLEFGGGPAILFGFLFLKEKLKPVHAFIVAGAFAGSLFIIKPSPLNMELVPAVIGLLGGMSAGAAYTFVRSLGIRGEKGPFIVCFFSGFSCLATLPYLLVRFHGMTLEQLGYLLLAGLAAAGGQFAITAAYCHAPAREISVYDYSQIIFSAVLGFVIFGQVPDRFSVLGYVIICAMAVVMFLYNRKYIQISA